MAKNKLTKKIKTRSEMIKSVKPENIGLTLVEEIKKMRNVEDLGTAILQSGHQFYLLIQSILKDKYGFNDKHLVDLNKEVTRAVEGLAYLEEKGLHPLSGHSIDQLVDVTLHHYKTLKMGRNEKKLPVSKKVIKILSKAREDKK